MTSVMYVDADREIGRLVCRTFEETSTVSVYLAGSGEEALTSSSLPFADVIVSDYHLPGMDGVGLLKKLRLQGICVPFIFFTHNFTTPLKEVACLKNVFRFNGKNGHDRREILRLLRIVYWVTGDHVTDMRPVIT
jgi:CheY-like chemotaxis protein